MPSDDPFIGRYRRALTIAGSDSGGGAGIQADLKTFAALGCYGMSVLTALTAQNTVGVTGIHPVPAEFVAGQIDAVLDDIGADVVKLGMLHSAEIIRVVAERLAHHKAGPIVVDPVMVATSGDRLLEDEAVNVMRTVMLPLATIITPNVPEAAALLGWESLDSMDQMNAACRELAELGPDAVLLKGGHLSGARSVDTLFVRADDALQYYDAPRSESPNTHGTGCTLASAVAAFLAHGESISRSVERAKSYMTGAIQAGAAYRLGRGHGPVHHFFEFWN